MPKGVYVRTEEHKRNISEGRKRYYDEHDYLKYMDYYIAEGYECGDYEIELRHYCFCIGKSEIVGMLEHNGKNYVQIKLNMSPDNSFLIITKDYLLNYDIRDIIIYIDEYGIDTYIDLNNYNYTKNGTNNLIDEKETLECLSLRKNILNGVTISGGEPTLQLDLKEFIKKVKNIGLDIKLDTNGLNFNLLKELVENKLIDYVAMDIKNSFNKYDLTSGVKNLNIENIKNSINFLKQNHIDYEFRTTIINEYHTIQDIFEIIELIGNSKYYLQNFKNSDNVLDKSLTSFTEEKLILWNEILKNYANVYIRGIEKGV